MKRTGRLKNVVLGGEVVGFILVMERKTKEFPKGVCDVVTEIDSVFAKIMKMWVGRRVTCEGSLVAGEFVNCIYLQGIELLEER